MNIKNFQSIVALIVVTLTGSVANAASSKLSEASASKPNIVVILVDDMGFADLSVTGCKEWQTPHIDRLCEQGMNFTAGSVSASQCGPSVLGSLAGFINSASIWTPTS